MIPVETFRRFGEALKQARQAKNRSLDDIASSIRVNRRHLESIEAGNLDALPQGPYALAFVREYAKAVNVPLPPELAPVPSITNASLKDPKVASRPRSGEERPAFTQVARETAKFAKTAVKTVSKTTENLVDFVESGSKEAIDVLTSKSLWEEAENTRRERHGLPPLPKPIETPPKRLADDKPLLGKPEPKETIVADDFREEEKPARQPIKVTKRATNLVILLLVIVFGAVAFFAIRMSKKETGEVASKDYVPAPVEKPQPISVPKRVAAPATAAAVTTPAIGPNDSLHFVLKATQPVWVSIAPDGIPAYRGELKAGETHQFHAAKEFVVNIGNQKSVSMSFDGQPLAGLPAVQGSNVVVRDLVLMRDKVTLGGNPVDLHALTTVPHPAPAPVIPAPVTPPTVHSIPNKPAATLSHNGTVPNHAGMPSVKKTSVTQSSNSSKSSRSNPKKPSSRPNKTPPITPVEPIPPRP